MSVTRDVDVALIGGGIMSATLGVLLKQVRPDASIALYERLHEVAGESSDPWNNAGTGHAAYCEMNYTPERADGSIDTSKALTINEQFHVSRQFWASMIEQGLLPEPKTFINPIPHMSYVHGSKDVDFLRKRYDALASSPLFASLTHTQDRATIAEWAPLVMQGRSSGESIAFTRSDEGTDVNFGKLTKSLVNALAVQGADVLRRHEVTDIERQSDGRWKLSVHDLTTQERFTTVAKFVFIGAGGRAIHLLQASGIPEAKGYGGFPVSGQFLRCTNPELIRQHRGKVYGKGQVNAPPMAMPHLDTRMTDGKPGLLFGPYAGFSPKFLKQGSVLDLVKSIRLDNILTMLNVAKDEFGLTTYLIKEVLQSPKARIRTLSDFMPTASGGDWELIHAGMRVQTMKRTAKKRGALEFGTEVVATKDGSLAGLLGASPGASTATSIMLGLLQRCFPTEYASWEPKLREIIPSVGVKLHDNPDLLGEVSAFTDRVLQLKQG